MKNFTSETIKETTNDQYGYSVVTLKVSGYADEAQRMYQVLDTMFGDSKVYTYRTLKGAQKKFNSLVMGA